MMIVSPRPETGATSQFPAVAHLPSPAAPVHVHVHGLAAPSPKHIPTATNETTNSPQRTAHGNFRNREIDMSHSFCPQYLGLLLRSKL